MTNSDLISVSYLRQFVEYRPKSGDFIWKPRPLNFFADARSQASWNTKHAGHSAFVNITGSGYFCGTIMKRKYLAHRVAWAVYYGLWPTKYLDHINGDPLDNRICNLRLSDAFRNMTNLKISKSNASGVTGVCRQHGKWSARIQVKGRKIHLGMFEAFDQAVQARLAAEREYGFLSALRALSQDGET